MRSKEEGKDYRFFPEPDLPPLIVSNEMIDQIKKTLPELPSQIALRLENKYQLTKKESILLLYENAVSYFEQILTTYPTITPKIVANWILNDLLKLLNEANIPLSECPISFEMFGALIQLIEQDVISGKIAKVGQIASLTKASKSFMYWILA